MKSFGAIVAGTKTVETRAATEKYRKVEVGDTLIFVCGTKRAKRKVRRRTIYRTIPALLKAVPMKKINPWAKSRKEVLEGYQSYTGYAEKLKKHGIIAFYI